MLYLVFNCTEGLKTTRIYIPLLVMRIALNIHIIFFISVCKYILVLCRGEMVSLLSIACIIEINTNERNFGFRFAENIIGV